MYTHQKTFHSVNAASFASTGIKLTVSPGLAYMIVRAAAVVVTTAMTVTAPVLSLKKRPTAGAAGGETTEATLTTPTARVAGDVVYKRGLNIKIEPGQNLTADVTTAATAGAADIVIEADYASEIPAALAKMFASA